LIAGVSIGQSPSPAAPPKAGMQNMMMMDSKMHQQMMGKSKMMSQQMAGVKKAIADERAKAGDPAMQKASDAKIEALEKSIHELQKQIEAVPQYLPQGSPNTP
jgi:hypothetical protein